jgi:hypothetical protein
MSRHVWADGNGGPDPSGVGRRQPIPEGRAGCEIGGCRRSEAGLGGPLRRPKTAPEAARKLAQRLNRKGLSLGAIAAKLAEKGLSGAVGQPLRGAER